MEKWRIFENSIINSEILEQRIIILQTEPLDKNKKNKDNEKLEKTLQELSVIELKALIYDEILNSNQTQRNIEILRTELAKK